MGEFYVGLSKACTKAAWAEIAGMVATFKAINFALEASFWNVILESDNISMTNDIRSNEESLASGSAIVVDINC